MHNIIINLLIGYTASKNKQTEKEIIRHKSFVSKVKLELQLFLFSFFNKSNFNFRNSIKSSKYNVVINLPKSKAVRSRSYNDEREQFKQIKCQRINNKNDLEEIEIFVPLSVHENLSV